MSVCGVGTKKVSMLLKEDANSDDELTCNQTRKEWLVKPQLRANELM